MAELVFERKRKTKRKPLAGADRAAEMNARVRTSLSPLIAHYQGSTANADWGQQTEGVAPSSKDPWQVLDATLDRPLQESMQAAEHGLDKGEPLPDALRIELENRFDCDFSEVVLHSGPEARQQTRRLSARAFTRGRHIWLHDTSAQRDARVLAHELTHVVQQGAVSRRGLPYSRAAGVGFAQRPKRAVNRTPTGHSTSRRAARSAGRGTKAAGAPVSRGGAVQRSLWDRARDFGGRVWSGVRAVGSGAVSVVQGAANLGRRALMAIVQRVAPDAVRLFSQGGFIGFIRGLVGRGLRALFDPVLARARSWFGQGNLDAFAQAANTLGAAFSAMNQQQCDRVIEGARQFGAFVSNKLQPAIRVVRSIASAVSGFFRQAWEAVGAPAVDLLRRIGGPLWEGLRSFAADIGRVLGRIRSAVGDAWQQVKTWLGIGADSEAEGGVWNWITDTARGVWQDIQRRLQPVMGPLRTVTGVLVMISPAGPFITLYRAWPHIRRAFQWIGERWRDLNLIVRARRFLAETLLPMLISGAERVGELLTAASEWVLGLLQRVSAGINTAISGLRGTVLAPLARVIGFINSGFTRLVRMVRDNLRPAARWGRSMLRRIATFMRPIWSVLLRLLMIAVNPAAVIPIVLGELWRRLADCLKGPIIDFILDVAIRVVRAIPGSPLLGLLWPFLRQSLIGFLTRIRSFATERKVRVANKIATIISGGSVQFFLGYLRGLLTGIWQAVIGPFQAIADIFRIPAMIQQLLQSMNLNFAELREQARQFLSTLRGRAVGTVQSLINAARDLFANPGRIVSFISSALRSALSAARGLGTRLADQMFQVFEGPDAQLGERVGNLAGGLLVNALLTYFTGGSAAAVRAIGAVVRVLARIGRRVLALVRYLLRQISRILRYVRRLAGRFVRSGSSAGGILGRIRAFFTRVVNWFRRIVRRFTRRRRRGRGRRGRQRRMWKAFLRRVRAIKLRHITDGVVRGQLQQELRNARLPFTRVVRLARVERRPKRRSPHWVMRVARRGGVIARLLRRRFEVLQDRQNRWRRGTNAVRRRLRWIPPWLSTPRFMERILRGLKRRWHFRTLEAVDDPANSETDIRGGMSPSGKITEKTTAPTGSRSDAIPLNWYKRPKDYKTITVSRSVGGPDIDIPFGATRYVSYGGRRRRIHADPNNVVQIGDCVRRSTSSRRDMGSEPARREFRDMLEALGFNWSNFGPDHILDRGFYGRDHFTNLWPIAASVNWRGPRFYLSTKVVFSKRVAGGWRKNRTNLMNAKGKWFKIIGYRGEPRRHAYRSSMSSQRTKLRCR